MFQHLDTNGDGNIDLAEFTRFCLEVRAGCTPRNFHCQPSLI